MKKSELIFGAIRVPIDFAALLISGALAYMVRTSDYVQSIRPALFEQELRLVGYMQLVAIVSTLIVGIFALQGLYRMDVTRKLVDEVTRIFSGVSMGVMAVIIYVFLLAELFQSRFILLSGYGIALVLVTLGRWLVRRVQVAALKRGYGVHKVVLVGNGRFADQLKHLFRQKVKLGYVVVAAPESVDMAELENIYKKRGIDEVIKTDPTLPEEDNLALLDFCDRYKIDYKYIPDIYETYAANIKFQQVAGVPMMELMRTPLDGWGRVAKRVIDVLGSVLGLIILSPLLLVTALIIIWDSRGPVFFKQTRIGRKMKKFEIIKFRSMCCEYCTGSRYGGEKAKKYEDELRANNNERNGGPLFKMKDDPRITRVGKILRKTRIDELPQLINVLKGEMSLIGPRPHLPSEVVKYTKYHRRLFTIKPGMSGMAQVNGNAGLHFEQEVKLDIGYIEDWSLWLDAILLIKTLRILFTDRNAV